MSTVGLSFGSATSGTGIDVSTTVTEILAAEQGIETPWKTELTSLQSQDTALTKIGTDLSTLSTALNSLTDFQGVLAGKQGSSSDTGIVQLTGATTAAVAGTHTVTVTQLAQTSSMYSDAAGAADTLSGTLTIKVGSGTAQSITLDTSDNTISTLAAAINSGGYGVTASVAGSGSNVRLVLTSATSGAAGQVTVGGTLTDATSSTALGFHTGQAGQDAAFTVDGISMTSGSNTVTAAIPGVTLQLLSQAATTPVQLVVTNDNSSVESAVSTLVTAYNAVVADLNAQEQNSSSGTAEPLYGNPSLALVQEQLSGAMLGGGASGALNSITQLGIELQKDGTLTLNTGTQDSVLNSDYTDVTGIFQNSGSFGQNLTTALNGLGNAAPYGTVYLALQQNSAQETALNTNISNEETRLSAEKTTLTTELNTVNQELQSIPQQLQQVNELYSAISGYSTSSTQGG